MALKTLRTVLFSDRRTARGITLLFVAIVVLMILIGFLTFFPARTITDTAQAQSAERQKLLAASLARQIEGLFNTLANDLVTLAARPAIQSMSGLREDAQKALAAVGDERAGQIRAIVRIAKNGTPRYAWPEGYLPAWSVDGNWVAEVSRDGGVQFTRRSAGGSPVYLLVAPILAGLNTFEALAIEVDIQGYFQSVFSSIDLGETGQLWVLTANGTEIYSHRPEIEFGGGLAQLLSVTDVTTLTGYPTADRETIVVPVYTSFTQSRTGIGSLVMLLSRTFSEANRIVEGTLSSLAFFSVLVIAFVGLLGLLISLYLLRESRRRQREETRRATANTLLEVSRALNSSLELDVVLRRILENLGNVLPHDSASVMLLNEDKTGLIMVAETGKNQAADTTQRRRVFEVNQVTAAQNVVQSHTPMVINNTEDDVRWTPVPGGRIRAWLGVPLSVREELVGVLSIDSYAADRFSPDAVGVAVAFADQAGVAIQNARAHEVQIKAYEAELETARAIQTSLLPLEPPPLPEFQVAMRSLPARMISGDFHQHFVLPGGKLGVAVGDVSGKGIPAALMMAVITTALRDEIQRTVAPAALIAELNSRLYDRLKQNQLNSGLLVSIFDPQAHCAEIAAGGMLSPYMRNGSGWHEVEVSGYPLGATASTAYRAQQVDLGRGSMIVFVTDGVVEARSPSQELFGFERFEALLNGLPRDLSADGIADAILEAVKKHQGDLEQQDDVTVVVVRS